MDRESGELLPDTEDGPTIAARRAATFFASSPSAPPASGRRLHLRLSRRPPSVDDLANRRERPPRRAWAGRGAATSSRTSRATCCAPSVGTTADAGKWDATAAAERPAGAAGAAGAVGRSCRAPRHCTRPRVTGEIGRPGPVDSSCESGEWRSIENAPLIDGAPCKMRAGRRQATGPAAREDMLARIRRHRQPGRRRRRARVGGAGASRAAMPVRRAEIGRRRARSTRRRRGGRRARPSPRSGRGLAGVMAARPRRRASTRRALEAAQRVRARDDSRRAAGSARLRGEVLARAGVARANSPSLGEPADGTSRSFPGKAPHPPTRAAAAGWRGRRLAEGGVAARSAEIGGATPPRREGVLETRPTTTTSTANRWSTSRASRASPRARTRTKRDVSRIGLPQRKRVAHPRRHSLTKRIALDACSISPRRSQARARAPRPLRGRRDRPCEPSRSCRNRRRAHRDEAK